MWRPRVGCVGAGRERAVGAAASLAAGGGGGVEGGCGGGVLGCGDADRASGEAAAW
jgi:hypothetical protein